MSFLVVDAVRQITIEIRDLRVRFLAGDVHLSGDVEGTLMKAADHFGRHLGRDSKRREDPFLIHGNDKVGAKIEQEKRTTWDTALSSIERFCGQMISF